MTAPWMPSLPERKWSMFCTKCGQRRRLDDKTELQHSEIHPGVAFAACPCGYTAFAEQAPYTTDQMRRAQADAARAALERAAQHIRHELTSVSASQEVKALAEWYATSLEQMAKEITP